MFRICVCLLIAFASVGVTAREFEKTSANGGGCSDSVAEKEPAAASARKAPPPARETRAKPGVTGGAIGNSRGQSTRWHSFLPGMFR